MSIPFVDRPPTHAEFERFRLILSTYQDGSGMLVNSRGGTLPGWRDFERSIALAFNGSASENKDIFDVRLPDPNIKGVNYGISCKMRREMDRVDRDGRVTIEMSNSARKFWDHLSTKDINQANYKNYLSEVGESLIELVQQWHEEVSLENRGDVDLSKSSYLALSWNFDGLYQLYQFKLALLNAAELNWYFPIYVRRGREVVANHLNGDEKSGRLFEWYGESGAQLKYYPLAETALWESERFRLEPLPQDRDHGIISKAQAYFSEQWPEVSTET
jgi:hypothetical protein